MALTPDAALVRLGRECGGEALNIVCLLRYWAEGSTTLIEPRGDEHKETAVTLARWILDGALDGTH